MKPALPRVLLLPGWLDSGPAHWQSRWQAQHGDTPGIGMKQQWHVGLQTLIASGNRASEHVGIVQLEPPGFPPVGDGGDAVTAFRNIHQPLPLIGLETDAGQRPDSQPISIRAAVIAANPRALDTPR